MAMFLPKVIRLAFCAMHRQTIVLAYQDIGQSSNVGINICFNETADSEPFRLYFSEGMREILQAAGDHSYNEPVNIEACVIDRREINGNIIWAAVMHTKGGSNSLHAADAQSTLHLAKS